MEKILNRSDPEDPQIGLTPRTPRGPRNRSDPEDPRPRGPPRPDFHRQVQRHYGLQDTNFPRDRVNPEGPSIPCPAEAHSAAECCPRTTRKAAAARTGPRL